MFLSFQNTSIFCFFFLLLFLWSKYFAATQGIHRFVHSSNLIHLSSEGASLSETGLATGRL